MKAAVHVEEFDFDEDQLPPGFRFHPTDEEIIMEYLVKKAADRRFSAAAIVEADLNKCEPWDLHRKSKFGEKERYFFFRRDRKYPTGMRTNRATESGYWKATGKDKEIFKGKSSLVGMKKTLVFYKGRAPKGEKTDWIMHEYRLDGDFSSCNLPRKAKEEWVVCRVFHKTTAFKRNLAFEQPRLDYDYRVGSPPFPLLSEYNEGFGNEEDDIKGGFIHPLNPISWPHSYNSPPTNNFHSLSTFQEGSPSHQGTSYSPHSTHVFPFKRYRQGMELYSDTKSVAGQSENTGISNETMTAHSRRDEGKEAFDEALNGINFSPTDISDLDSFWSY